eukprot:4528201-Pyramimonas_sp.AAC.1
MDVAAALPAATAHQGVRKPFVLLRRLLGGAGGVHTCYLPFLCADDRVLSRASRAAPIIKPRSLVDDIGLQMVSPDLGDAKLLLL